MPMSMQAKHSAEGGLCNTAIPLRSLCQRSRSFASPSRLPRVSFAFLARRPLPTNWQISSTQHFETKEMLLSEQHWPH